MSELFFFYAGPTPLEFSLSLVGPIGRLLSPASETSKMMGRCCFGSPPSFVRANLFMLVVIPVLFLVRYFLLCYCTLPFAI